MRSSKIRQTRSAPQNGTRAAQYLRMSTDHQKYSTENQAEAVAKYAEQRGLTIVRTYQDGGRSGLQLKDRPALKQLISDAQNGVCNFKTVLVYDVSRWGRFQDVDESAYYEFICKEAGIGIHYCAEQFENDGSPLAALIKSLKRAMAAEYSRELSVKVFAGQWTRHKIFEVLKNEKYIGNNVFNRRSHKLRLRLVSNPPEMWVRTIGCFASIIDTKLFLKAKRLMEVRESRRGNPPDKWIRATGCFEPIVQTKLFLNAKQRMDEHKKHFGDRQYLLDCLRTLLAKEGRLSVSLIDANKYGPKHATYQRWFGGFRAAYRLIGYEPQFCPRGEDGKFIERLPSPASKTVARKTVKQSVCRTGKHRGRRRR